MTDDKPAEPRMTIAFVGDATTAYGYRLAGVQVWPVAPDDDVAPVLERARERCDVVLITAAAASRLPPPLRASALASAHPLMLVVPDARDRDAIEDLARRWKQQIGVES